jgi:hypothetical protein
MKLYYDNLALHNLGVLRIGGQRSELVPPEGPARRRRVTFTVRIDCFTEVPGGDWAALRDKVEQVRERFTVPDGVLLWRDDDNAVRLNQSVRVVGHDLPDDPNEWGRRHQAATITFEHWDHDFTPNVPTVKFTPSGGSQVTLPGVCYRFRESRRAQRYSPKRKHRSGIEGTVFLAGQILATPTDTPAVRRAALISQLADLRTAFAAAEGALVYSEGARTAFSETVRAAEFDGDVNEAATAIDWSLSATFDAYPTGDYAQADYTVRTRTDEATGESRTVLAGTIEARTLALAETKLAALRTAHVSGLTRVGETETDASRVDGADGADFLRLSFNETYKATSGTALEWELRVADSDDTRAGLIRRSYTGRVTATGATWDVAYQTGHTKAVALGGNKLHFQLRSDITAVDRQQSADRVGTGNVQVTVEFTFEYQLKDTGRIYVEVSAATQKDAFAMADVERVSGTVTAGTKALADAVVDELRALYVGKVIRNDQRTADRVEIAQNVSASATAKTPPNAGSWGTTVNGNEAAGTLGGSRQQHLRLGFGFDVVQSKGSSELAVKYSLRIQRNRLTLEQTAQLSGQVAADTVANASWVADLVASLLDLGEEVADNDGTEREQLLGARASSGDETPTLPGSGEMGVCVAYTFDREYRDRLAGPDHVLECSVSDDVQFSGTRWQTQATAYGRDVIQACGIASGRRAVSGYAVAATEAIALAWVRRQYHLPFRTGGAEDFPEAPATRYRNPPKLTWSPRFVPLTDGTTGEEDEDYNANEAAANVQVWRLDFSYDEVLPSYDWTP